MTGLTAGPSYRPKRLLAISQGDAKNDSTYVVVDEDTQRVPYATLSYKWGHGQKPTLTKDRLRKSPGRGSLRFHVRDLPKTIGDAVFVCQSLGIRYLWVDALCIVQDNGQDKAEQIGLMQQIYSHCTIAIVASRANSSMGGFLHPRLEPGKGLGDTCRVAYRSKEGDEGSIILRLKRHKELLRKPLHERGWAYQEFLLPPRIVDYGSMQTTYHCRECESTVTDGGISSSDAPMLLTRRMGFCELLKQHSRGSITELGRGRVTNEVGVKWRPLRHIASWPLEDSWRLFVEECTIRQLSIPADRLNTMSAIATIFSKLTDQKDEYLAGHWRSGFPESLMWSRNWQNSQPDIEFHSSETYFAPSWSWPSVNGSIKFKYQYGKAGDIDVDFKINDCRVQVTDPLSAPFASVSSGCLYIRAKTLRANVNYRPEEFEIRLGQLEHNIHIPSGNLPSPFNLHRPDLPTYVPDGLNEVPEGTSMSVLLVVFEMASNTFPNTTGMVVKGIGNGLYRRIGWFNNLANIYRRAWPVQKYSHDFPESDGQRGRPLDMELVKKRREEWSNIFELKELKIM